MGAKTNTGGQKEEKMRLNTYKGNDTVFAISYDSNKREEVLNQIRHVINDILNDNIDGDIMMWFGWHFEDEEKLEEIIAAVQKIDGVINIRKITKDTPSIEKFTIYFVWDDVNNAALLDSENMREEYIL